MPITWWMLDIAVILVFAFFVWRGWHRGFVMGIAGIVILVLSIFGASLLSRALCEPVAESLSQIIGVQAGEAAEEAIDTYGRPDINDENANKQVAAYAFEKLGIQGGEAEKLIDEAWRLISQNSGETLKNALMRIASRLMAQVILFLFFFIALTIMLHIVFRVIRIFFELPILKQLDKFGGLGFGVLFGLLFLFAIGWGLRYSGLFLTAEQINETYVLKFFAFTNPLQILL